jgi:phosphoribosylanthranilate isomerase
MTTTRVKICGLTRTGDIADVVAAGAWAVGFVCWPESARAVTPARMRELAATVPPGVRRVAVVVNATVDQARTLADAAALTTLQLHGDEDVTPFLSLGLEVIKAVSLETDDDLERASGLPDAVTVLVDAHDPIRRGGTGHQANWDRAALLATRRPVILAGGLTPDNVRAALGHVRPWGVDVSSGVEVAPGIKNRERIQALLQAVHEEPL